MFMKIGDKVTHSPNGLKGGRKGIVKDIDKRGNPYVVYNVEDHDKHKNAPAVLTNKRELEKGW